MKYSIVATLVVLALAHGSIAQDMPDFAALTQFFEGLTSKMTELMESQDLAGQAQTFLEDKRTQLEPLAAQLQEQMKTVASSVGEQMTPLATSMQPVMEKLQQQMEAILKQLGDQTKAIQS